MNSFFLYELQNCTRFSRGSSIDNSLFLSKNNSYQKTNVITSDILQFKAHHSKMTSTTSIINEKFR